MFKLRALIMLKHKHYMFLTWTSSLLVNQLKSVLDLTANLTTTKKIYEPKNIELDFYSVTTLPMGAAILITLLKAN